MLAPLLAAAAAILPFGDAPTVDGATTLYASFDDERQPVYGFVAGEPTGDAEPIADGWLGGAWRLRDGTQAVIPLAEESWKREVGTLEFWLRPEWSETPGSATSIVSLYSNASDRLYVNRLADGRVGAAIMGGSADDPRWVRTDLPGGQLRSDEWHHIAVSWGNGTLEIRLDGELLAEPVDAIPMDEPPNRLVLGRGDFSIDELRISDIRRYPGPVIEAGREPDVNRATRRYATIEPAAAYAFDAVGARPDERFRIAVLHPTSEPNRGRLPVASPEIRLSSAKGERQPAKLAVYAMADLGGLSIGLSEPPIDGLRLEVRRVVRSPMRRFYRAPPDDQEVIPRFLATANRLSVPRGEFRELWLTFDVPEDAPRGFHMGALELRVAGSEPTRIPLSIEIHPFTLPDASGKRMGIYYMAARRMIEPTRLREELADLRAHGVTDLVLDFRLAWRRGAEGVRVSSPGLERFIEAATAAGFHHTLVVDTGFIQLERLFDETETRQMIQAARKGAALIAELDDRFPGEIAVTHLDEVFADDRLQQYIRLARIARAAGYPRLYATFHTRDPDADTKRQRLSPFVDIRGHHGFTFEWWLARGHTMAEYEAELLEAGSEAWLYHNVRGSYFPPIWGRLINGLYLRASPFVLNAPWAYQDYRGNPYDDADAPRADLGMAFPEPEGAPGLAPTLVWEQMREGQEDLRTLALLESLAREDPERFADDLAWLARLDAVTREARPGSPSEPEESEAEGDGRDAVIDLDTGLRFGAHGIGTRQEAPLIDALSRRFDGAALDAIRLEASHRISRILEGRVAAP